MVEGRGDLVRKLTTPASHVIQQVNATTIGWCSKVKFLNSVAASILVGGRLLSKTKNHL